MNEITTAPTTAVSAETMHHVLGSGDLSRLTIPQRVEYYAKVCQTVGLNPLTQPFRFLTFQGQIKLYATRDCADQLRHLRKINLLVTDKRIEDDLLIVTVQAETVDGRKDEDVGAVVIGALKGEARANAVMKAVTKAKRRVTLSVCGLGFLDEGEVETLPGAQTFAADEPLPPNRGGRASPQAPAAVELPPPDVIMTFAERAKAALENEPDKTKWLRLLGNLIGEAATLDDIAAIRGLNAVRDAEAKAQTTIKGLIADMWRGAMDRLLPSGPAPAPAPVADASPTFEDDPMAFAEPAEDHPLIQRVEKELKGLESIAAIEAWARGPVRPLILDARKNDRATFEAVIAIIDRHRQDRLASMAEAEAE